MTDWAARHAKTAQQEAQRLRRPSVRAVRAGHSDRARGGLRRAGAVAARRAGRARCAGPADHRRQRAVQRAARRRPRRDAAPPRRAGAARSRVPLAVARRRPIRRRAPRRARPRRRSTGCSSPSSRSAAALTPSDRVRTIYPRYLGETQFDGPDGLKVISFKDGSPYQNEDLFFDPAAQPGFVARCTRPGRAGLPGMCALERRIDTADVIVRFPSEWLTRLARGERGDREAAREDEAGRVSPTAPDPAPGSPSRARSRSRR